MMPGGSEKKKKNTNTDTVNDLIIKGKNHGRSGTKCQMAGLFYYYGVFGAYFVLQKIIGVCGSTVLQLLVVVYYIR